MNIHIKTIPGEEQRYPTVGDWQWSEEGDLTITVSQMGNWKYEYLIAFHELIEVMLCRERNIRQEQVDDFDKRFEQMRGEFPEIIGNKEPGNDENAPYYKEHQFATSMEQDMSDELGVDWEEYTTTVYNL